MKSPIRVYECLDALIQCHTRKNIFSDSVSYQISFFQHFKIYSPEIFTTNISTVQIAQQFTTMEAAKHLSQQQFHQLLSLLGASENHIVFPTTPALIPTPYEALFNCILSE
jgi:hypothetical protein